MRFRQRVAWTLLFAFLAGSLWGLYSGFDRVLAKWPLQPSSELNLLPLLPLYLAILAALFLATRQEPLKYLSLVVASSSSQDIPL